MNFFRVAIKGLVVIWAIYKRSVARAILIHFAIPSVIVIYSFARLRTVKNEARSDTDWIIVVVVGNNS